MQGIFAGLVADINEVTAGTYLDFQALQRNLLAALGNLDWSDPLAALTTACSTDWLTPTVHACLKGLLGDRYQAAGEQIALLVETAVGRLLGSVVLCLAFAALGLFCGYFLTKFLIRRNIARRAWWKYFLVQLVDSLLSVTLIAFCSWLLTLWKASVFFSSLASVFLFGFVSLFEAYVVHAWGKVDGREVINAKNIGKLLLTNLGIFAIALALVSLMTALTNALVGAAVALAVLEIAFIVISLNAESYVKSFAAARLPAPNA